MKEFIYSRNAVYETLRARRRQIFEIEIADSAQEKGKLAEIIKLANERKIKVHRVQRAKLDKDFYRMGTYPLSLTVSCPASVRNQSRSAIAKLSGGMSARTTTYTSVASG